MLGISQELQQHNGRNNIITKLEAIALRKIKSMMIEEIFMLFTVIVMELNLSKLENMYVETDVLSIILSFSIFIVLAKAIEVLIERMVYGKKEEIGILRKLIRNSFCFVLTSLAFFLIFCVFTKTELIAGALSIAILLLSGGYAFIHLIVSHFIENVMGINRLNADDQYEVFLDDCETRLELNDDCKEDNHEH